MEAFPFNEILIIGDWILDDNWVIGSRRTPTSTVTGKHHYRSLHARSSDVKVACGAGRVASVVYRSLINGNCLSKESQLYGIGTWDINDDRYFLRMFNKNQFSGSNSFRVTNAKSEECCQATLFNLARIVGHGETNCGTTRVYRYYQRQGDSLQLLSRLDWELSALDSCNGAPSWITDLGESRTSEVVKELHSVISRDSFKKIKHIVIKDNGKGVVTERLFKLLKCAYGESCLDDKLFYVISKNWMPQYLQSIKSRVRLLVLQAVSVTDSGLNTWFTPKGVLTYDALKKMNIEYQTIANNLKPLFVVIPGRHQIVAIEGDNLFTQPHQIKHGENEVPGTETAFFTTLFYGLYKSDTIDLRSLLNSASKVSTQWIDELNTRLKRCADEYESKEIVLKYDHTTSKVTWLDASGPVPDVSPVQNTSILETFWQNSLSGLGVYQYGGEYYINIHSACLDLPKYVCCTPAKRAFIQTMATAVTDFNPSTDKRPLSFLLLSRPGSGKTSMIKSLYDKHNINYMNYNVTNFSSINDLLDSFERIVTRQLESKGEKLMVFYDEINAKISNENIYSYFLTVLEDGYYYRRGNKFSIRPCIWLFAGTKGKEEMESSEKGSDFLSRISTPVMDMSKTPEIESEMESIEKIYIGIGIASGIYNGLTKVRPDVLGFLKLLDNVSVRDIKKIIESEFRVSHNGVGAWNDDYEKLLERHSEKLHKRSIPVISDLLSTIKSEHINVEFDTPTVLLQKK